MKFDDLNDIFKKAFAEVTPVDEAQKAKLEKLQQFIQDSNKQMEQTLDGLKQELEDNARTPAELRARLAQRQVSQENFARICLESLQAQNEILEKIVSLQAGALE